MTNRSLPCPEPEPESSKPRPVLRQIGRAGKPVRALAFAGGGFDTAMQLGVVHALLVCRGRAPDVVIGCSAGAVNAVALAEVLQAGEDVAERVARFRKIYDEYLKAPGVIVGEAQPDTFQVDTLRPLEPLKLPIHHRLDRDGRLDEVAVRAGIINLYNTLLSIRLTFGTMTRALRRWLGVRAAGNIQDRMLQALVQVGEWLRAWMLLGANVSSISPLVPLLIEAAAHTKPEAEHGATAGALIFRSRLWSALQRVALEWIALLLLATAWLLCSALASGLVGYAPVLLWELIPGGSHVHFLGWTIPAAILVGAGLLALVLGVVADAAPEEPLLTWWRKALYAAGVSIRALPRAVWATVLYVLLMVRWGIVVGLIAGAPLVIDWALTVQGPRSWETFTEAERLPATIVAGVLMAVVLVVVWKAYRGRKTIGIGLLGRFSLDKALLNPHSLRQLIIKLFDPGYYGDLNVDRAVESALRNDNQPTDGPRNEKYLEDYADTNRNTPIHVLVTVADVATADFDLLPGTYRVVDGLIAAVAAPPLFPPVSSGRRLFVDGAVVANDPSRPLFRFLRRAAATTPPLVNLDATALHLYTVSPVPFSRPNLPAEPDERRPGQPREYTNLVDVVRRSLALQRFRDARLERTLTELLTKSMPAPGSIFYPPTPPGSDKRFVRTWVYPIEPERPLTVNMTVLAARGEMRRREVIAETVADGCRSALSVMMREAVDAVGVRLSPSSTRKTALCRLAREEHLRRQAASDIAPLPGSADQGDDNGPGLAEVCSHCALFRQPPMDPCASKCAPPTKPLHPERPRALLWDPQQVEAPTWPVDNGVEPDWGERPISAQTQVQVANQQDNMPRKWPRQREGAPAANDRPTVSVLFSGGVFRGVFQVGVLSGLSEAGLVPDVVAGASVGSITAAMVARAFFGYATMGAVAPRADRQAAIQRLAAAYLAIDRMVLTDRFADFIRGLTVRAAQAHFSIRQGDRVIRRFDDGNPWTFNRDVRAVVAGIERLTYVSPFELLGLLEAFRGQHADQVMKLLQANLQELLDRAGVGTEVLGAEPLALLVQEYVLKGLAAPGVPPATITFQEFLNQQLVFLATTTNMTEGRLEVLGEEQLFAPGGSGLNLLHALLASSAFPAVFRPRLQWEIWPRGGLWHQYIDGGVMDNLPLDAVAQFLHTAAQSGLIPYRPAVPHLVFSASLETETQPIIDDQELDRLRHHWPRLFGRARRLGYNTKLDMFARSQRNVRAIMTQRMSTGAYAPGQHWTPLDLWVTTVIPKWLCGTFAFHPMLGFRQWKQAASIAHGCASTLLALGREAALPTGGAARAAAWGMETPMLPSAAQCGAADPFVPLASPAAPGNCWYRPTVPCPFSAQGHQGGSLRTGDALAEIHRRCGQIKTHRPQ